MILGNGIVYMLIDYKYRLYTDQEQQQYWEIIAEYFFSVIFTMEFILKIISMGFVLEKGTYLRDGWNQIDFIVVLSCVLSFIPSLPKLSLLKVLRTIRPLRGLKTIRGIRVLVESLIDSLPALANVILFLGFFVVLFSILGTQLFLGLTENRCRITKFPQNGVWIANDNIKNLCNIDENSCPDKYILLCFLKLLLK